MLNKNFFTRKLIIPTYASGYHPYLNNMALIMNDRQYSRVLNYGMSIEPIGKSNEGENQTSILS